MAKHNAKVSFYLREESEGEGEEEKGERAEM
jgi:hypothetical protein